MRHNYLFDLSFELSKTNLTKHGATRRGDAIVTLWKWNNQSPFTVTSLHYC